MKTFKGKCGVCGDRVVFKDNLESKTVFTESEFSEPWIETIAKEWLNSHSVCKKELKKKDEPLPVEQPKAAVALDQYLPRHLHRFDTNNPSSIECAVCKGDCESLPTECPGIVISLDRLEQITKNQIDFVNGEWIEVK